MEAISAQNGTSQLPVQPWMQLYLWLSPNHPLHSQGTTLIEGLQKTICQVNSFFKSGTTHSLCRPPCCPLLYNVNMSWWTDFKLSFKQHSWALTEARKRKWESLWLSWQGPYATLDQYEWWWLERRFTRSTSSGHNVEGPSVKHSV